MTRQCRLLNVLVAIRWLVLLYTGNTQMTSVTTQYVVKDVTDAVCDVQCSSCYDSRCQVCNTGHYRDNNFCYTCSSNCAECDGPESTQCRECVAGKYGPHCQTNCRDSKCVDNKCRKRDGTCTNGCIDGYYHSNSICIQCPTDCITCSSSTSCYKCLVGRWGNDCQKDCYLCVDNKCNRRNGKCNRGCIGGAIYDKHLTQLCFMDCKCCINNECAQGMCVDGCKNGYFWQEDKCSICTTASSACDRLDDVTDAVCDVQCSRCYGSICQKCNTGHYLDNNACYTCSSNCTKCVGPESTQCHECVAGKYGSDCQTNCRSSKCVDNVCNQHDGTCTYGCIDGYYHSTKICIKCPTDCITCISSTSCYECLAGRWGNDCQKDCFLCVDNECNRNGKCTQGCVDGALYDSHTHVCFINCTRCINNKCSQGMCVDGCKNGYFWQKDKCSKCPTACSACDRLDGKCLHGCEEGLYGDQCDHTCSIPNCELCANGIGGMTCSTCLVNFYKESEMNCSRCSPHCASGSACDRITGSCPDGCAEGWQGDMCNTKCSPGCVACHQADGACARCLPGKHGASCEQSCSSGCQADNGIVTCAVVDGTCTNGCVTGYWTSNCESLCNDACLNSACNKSTGECIDGCMPEYFGGSCDSRCSINCLTASGVTDVNICARIDGRCNAGCRDGYHSETCDAVCGNCQHIMCHRSNGTCVYGCTSGYIGSLCNEAPVVGAQEDDNVATVGALVGGVVVGIGSIVAVCVYLVIRRRRSSGSDRDDAHMKPTLDDINAGVYEGRHPTP